MEERFYISEVIEINDPVVNAPPGTNYIGAVIHQMVIDKGPGRTMSHSYRINRPEEDWALVRIECDFHDDIVKDTRNKLLTTKDIDTVLTEQEKTDIDTKVPITLSNKNTLGDVLDETMKFVYNNQDLNRYNIIKDQRLNSIK